MQAQNYTGVWSDSSKSGQGVTLLHETDTLAGAWYLYDENGNGMWVTFIGQLTDNSANVELLRFTGPPLDAPWDPSQVVAAVVGSASLSFASPASIQFNYIINGVSGSLNLQPFTLTGANADEYSGVWSDTSQSGQGVTLLHEAGTLSGAWYLYDENGNGMWVTFIGQLTDNSANVELLRFSGPPLDGDFDPSQVTPQVIGNAGLAFSSADAVAFNYVVNGRSGALNLSPFRLQQPACENIAGNWSATETINLTCSADGETISDSVTDTATVVISQTGCDVSFDLPGFSITRTGMIEGNFISISGPFVISLFEDVNFTQNVMTAQGVVEGDQISMTGTGTATAIVDGISASCSGDSVATMNRTNAGLGPCADIAGLYRGTLSEVYCDGQSYSDSFAAVVDAQSCTIQYVTAEGSFGTEIIDGNAFTITTADSECGTLTGSGVIEGNTIMGSYQYSAGGSGTFSGAKAP